LSRRAASIGSASALRLLSCGDLKPASMVSSWAARSLTPFRGNLLAVPVPSEQARTASSRTGMLRLIPLHISRGPTLAKPARGYETSPPLVAYSPSTPASVQLRRAHELGPQSRKSGWILVSAPRSTRPAAPHLHPQQTLRARQRRRDGRQHRRARAALPIRHPERSVRRRGPDLPRAGVLPVVQRGRSAARGAARDRGRRDARPHHLRERGERRRSPHGRAKRGRGRRLLVGLREATA